MRAVAVVVRGVLSEHAHQVVLAEDKQMIEAFTPNASDPTFGMTVGLRRLDRGKDDHYALGREHLVEGSGELCVPVSDQEPDRGIGGFSTSDAECR